MLRRADSPLGPILLAADELGLTGLWFEGQKYFARGTDLCVPRGDCMVFDDTLSWLELYFSGRDPGKIPQLHLQGTPFQISVWHALQKIPYGSVSSYGTIAAELAAAAGIQKMSARAVGNAIGRNPISILVPCHRVLGAGGSLTGYAGGIDRKKALLALEGIAVYS